MSKVVRVLVVTDDQSVRDDAARHLERTGSDVAVLAESTVDGALERLSSAVVDCVVTDYRLPDGDGLALLAAVRERRPGLPVILCASEGSERVASEAIGAGVTDYVVCDDEDGTCDRLATAVESAVAEARERERLARMDRVRRVVREVHEAIVGAGDREAVVESVCEVLAAAEPYRFAWLGRVGDDDRVVPEAVAGAHDGYLDAVTVTVDESETGGGPTGRAVRTGEMQVTQDVRTDEAYEPWRAAARERDVASAAAVPLVADGERHGVLNVYADRPDAFGETERALLETVGENVALALERVALDAAVREAKRRSEGIISAAPNAILIADADGEILEANEAAGDLWECDPDALVGRNQVELHPAGETERYRALFERHAGDLFAIREFDDGSQVHVETLDGRQVPVEISARPIDLTDRRLVVGIFRDVRDERYREAAMERLLAASEELVAARSRERMARTAVAAAEEILGFRKVGIHLREGPDGPLRPVALSDQVERELDGDAPAIPPGEGLVWRALETGESQLYADVTAHEHCLNPETSVRSEIHVPLGDEGALIAGSTAVGAFDDEDARLLELLGANTRSALERVDRERQLEAHEAELEAQNERLLQFASVLSHDLRNPLNVASMYREMAADAVSGETADHLARIADAHERMERIIDDLLWLAKEGQEIGSTEPVDLASAAEEAWSSVSTAEASLAVDDGGTVVADADRLRQLLENLFRNAVEHGGPDVTVTVATLDDGFRVADDGPGLPDRDDLFEAGVSTDADGTGLGLSIVARIADAHGWEITTGESEGGGARFDFHGAGA